MNVLREILNVRCERAVLFDAARDAAAKIAHPALGYHKCMKVQSREL